MKDVPPSEVAETRAIFETEHRMNTSSTPNAYACGNTVKTKKMTFWRPKHDAPVTPKEFPPDF